MMRFVFLPVLTLFLTMGLNAHAANEGEKGRFESLKKEFGESLDSLDKKIDELENKAKEAKAETKKEWEKAVSDLKKNRDEIKEEIKKTKEASKEKASDFSTRIKSALAELKEGIEKAAAKVKGNK